MTTAIILFVLGTPIGIWWYYDAKWGRQLDKELAALRAQEAPLTIIEAVPAPPPDDENAAVLYQEIFQVRFGSDAPAWPEGQKAQWLLKDVTGALEYDDDNNVVLDAKARELLSSPEAQKVLETLRRGSEMPYFVFPVNWEDGFGALFPHVAQCRNAARLNAAYARLLAKDGRTGEALDWCTVSLRISEQTATEPTQVAQLVSYAIQAITFKTTRDVVSAAEVLPAVARELDAYLSGIDLDGPFEAALQGKRAVGCDAYELFRRDPQQLWQELATHVEEGAPWGGLYCNSVARPLHKLDQLEYLEYTAKQQDLLVLPYRDAVSELAALAATPPRPFIAAIIAPVLGSISRRRDQAAAEIGLCRIVLALKAYKHTRNSYPATLGQLQQTLQHALPKDPFSGEDFVYQPQGEGFKLYSLGGDLDDDGGVPPDEANPGDGDIVWECIR